MSFGQGVKLSPSGNLWEQKMGSISRRFWGTYYKVSSPGLRPCHKQKHDGNAGDMVVKSMLPCLYWWGLSVLATNVRANDGVCSPFTNPIFRCALLNFCRTAEKKKKNSMFQCPMFLIRLGENLNWDNLTAVLPNQLYGAAFSRALSIRSRFLDFQVDLCRTAN